VRWVQEVEKWRQAGNDTKKFLRWRKGGTSVVESGNRLLTTKTQLMPHVFVATKRLSFRRHRIGERSAFEKAKSQLLLPVLRPLWIH
jgi:hypothetical protein